jgi:dipeptidyl-peptidase-4
MSTPQDNPEGYKDTSSVLAAANLKGRLLIAHGTYDDNVHPQNTEAFINALIANNIQFELMIYPWRKHGIGDLPARKHLYTLMLDFWRRNLFQ